MNVEIVTVAIIGFIIGSMLIRWAVATQRSGIFVFHDIEFSREKFPYVVSWFTVGFYVIGGGMIVYGIVILIWPSLYQIP